MNIIKCEPDFVSKQLWYKASTDQLNKYRLQLDELLNDIHIPLDAIMCCNKKCDSHNNIIEQYHDDIINTCIIASNCIPMSKPGQPKIVPGWNEYIKVYQEKALFWHKLWKENNSPKSGVLHDIRRKTRY